jgi:L-lactate utilization protein LutC
MDYAKLASDNSVNKTIEALKKRNVDAVVVNTREEALEKVRSLIPKKASINNGSSTTLEEIGFVDLLKSGKHDWNNLHAGVLAEKDPVKQGELRKLSSFADYYLGSVHAMSENGEMVVASASGSQIPSLSFTSKNLILVVGIQKIMPDLDSAFKRLREHVYPLENERMKKTGAPGTVMAKILVLEQEPAFMGRKVLIIFVKEKLGF